MKARYPSVEQRIADSYCETLPPFTPDESAQVPVRAQQAFHDWLSALQRTLAEQPQLMFSTLNEDGHFTYRFNRAHDKAPKLDQHMRAAVKKIDALLETLFALGAGGRLADGGMYADASVSVSKAQRAVLEACGVTVGKRDGAFFVTADADVLAAWRWMASRPGASAFALSKCLFDERHCYAADVYAPLLGDERAFRHLISALEDRAYTRIDNRDGQMALDYVKDYGAKPTPVKDAWGEREHAGISLKYYNYVAKPACLCLRVPRLKSLLERFDAMEPSLQAFVTAGNKHCDGCGYCTQTDKTGKRAPVFVTVGADKPHNLCPLFPGFYYCWETLDMELAENILRFLNFIDETLSQPSAKQ